MPISSLPSDYGIGCFSKSAYEFVDWLKEAGQTYWQILPLGPTSYGDSPYQSFSTFAGNPYFIDLDTLVEEGVLDKKDCEKVNWGKKPDEVDYEKIYKGRYPLLRKAYENSDISKNPDYQKFVAENSWWLSDYALFMAVKDRFEGVEWTKWAEDIRLRWNNAMDYYREELYFDIEFQQYMQFKFYEQWMKLKSYANSKGIQIIGDIPIYVAMDSADAWAHPELFQLDQDNVPLAVAGCPPDGFSATGQLWGNPLYRWDYHRNTGYQWWISRMSYCFRLYDVVRIDHFRGFDEYFSIPYGDKDARGGHWEKGPGIDLFRKIEQALGWKQAGGFTEELAVAFNDVDLCLKVRKNGYLIVYDPYAKLYHMESKTRGAEDSKEKVRRFQTEIEYMRCHWIDILKNGDPCYNKNLSLTKWNYSLKPILGMETEAGQKKEKTGRKSCRKYQ